MLAGFGQPHCCPKKSSTITNRTVRTVQVARLLQRMVQRLQRQLASKLQLRLGDRWPRRHYWAMWPIVPAADSHGTTKRSPHAETRP